MVDWKLLKECFLTVFVGDILHHDGSPAISFNLTELDLKGLTFLHRDRSLVTVADFLPGRVVVEVGVEGNNFLHFGGQGRTWSVGGIGFGCIVSFLSYNPNARWYELIFFSFHLAFVLGFFLNRWTTPAGGGFFLRGVVNIHINIPVLQNNNLLVEAAFGQARDRS